MGGFAGRVFYGWGRGCQTVRLDTCAGGRGDLRGTTGETTHGDIQRVDLDGGAAGAGFGGGGWVCEGGWPRGDPAQRGVVSESRQREAGAGGVPAGGGGGRAAE